MYLPYLDGNSFGRLVAFRFLLCCDSESCSTRLKLSTGRGHEILGQLELSSAWKWWVIFVKLWKRGYSFHVHRTYIRYTHITETFSNLMIIEEIISALVVSILLSILP